MKRKRKGRRYLAGLLSLVMMLTMAPVSMADDTATLSEGTTVTEGGETAGQTGDTSVTEGGDEQQTGGETGSGTESGDTTTGTGTENPGTQESGTQSGSEGSVGGENQEGEPQAQSADNGLAVPNDLSGDSRAASAIYDMSGNNITNSYDSQLDTLNKSSIGDISISWSRSDEDDEECYDYRGKVTSNQWEWRDVSGIDLSITKENLVWDGSRLDDYGNVNHKFTRPTYLDDDVVSSYQNKLYDSATWTKKNDWQTGTTVHRFQGKFTLPDGENPNEYDYTLKQVTNTNKV